MSLLNTENCLLVAIDFQERLVGMLEKPDCAVKMEKLITAAGILKIPTIVTEQYPQGLGKTVANIDVSAATVIEKTAFSAMQQEEFKTAIEASGKKQIIIGGIETHICVHQTVAELIEAMKQNGAKITCLEIVLFELLRTSRNPNFKPIQALIK